MLDKEFFLEEDVTATCTACEELLPKLLCDFFGSEDTSDVAVSYEKRMNFAGETSTGGLEFKCKMKDTVDELSFSYCWETGAMQLSLKLFFFDHMRIYTVTNECVPNDWEDGDLEFCVSAMELIMDEITDLILSIEE